MSTPIVNPNGSVNAAPLADVGAAVVNATRPVGTVTVAAPAQPAVVVPAPSPAPPPPPAEPAPSPTPAPAAPSVTVVNNPPPAH